MNTCGNEKVYDLVIRDGTVIDVVNECLIQANIGIEGEKIGAITKETIQGTHYIDAKGLMISPGFIDFHSHVDGKAYAAECLVRQGGTTTLGGERNLNGKIIKEIAEEGFIINHGFFVSQPFVLRDAAGVKSTYASASDKEIGVMAELAGKFMEFGACGICFPLELIPGVSQKEFIEISKVARAYNKIVTIHIRKDGSEALDTFDEIFEMAIETGVKVHLLELMYMVGMAGTMPKALELIDQARKSGIDITGDSGVYDAFTVCIGTGVFDDGWERSYGGRSYESLIVSSGIHMGERCNEKLFKELREKSPSTLITAFVGDHDAVAMALKKDYIYVSTNAADGPFYPTCGSPEVAGTFPRLIGRYVRQERELSLMEAIKKITILPARRFNLQHIGSIEVGKNADIVIFHYDTIIDRAGYVNQGSPDALPIGIHYVLVNGSVVVEKGAVVGDRKRGKFVTASDEV
ncbi:N-acyl-D-amino-acid deacylase [Oscillibacter sp. PC13]|uniref:amidohydrolase family protein n=1 Tax=Oscillibacter sp. PC13 TaxID=1855299 RepID=UPI0008EBC123|nr:amidohydrolase family protein [Oscillibacter sp. PC13]SFP51780.1 N-acyl-D-amino-acid deacylase [Oscillibacter sp. PC13]